MNESLKLFSKLRLRGLAIFAVSMGLSLTLYGQQPPPNPCVGNEKLKQFDFWVGDWEVRVASGVLAGTNSITREQNGCVLVERWENTAGGTGTSINFFDEAKQQWVQMWNGAGGSQINISGGLVEGSMVLVGTLANVGSPQVLDFRGTWTLLDDGRVRQFFEQSVDKGKTWQTWFEGFYKRKSQ